MSTSETRRAVPILPKRIAPTTTRAARQRCCSRVPSSPTATPTASATTRKDNCPSATSPARRTSTAMARGRLRQGHRWRWSRRNASDAFPRDRNESADSDRDAIGDGADPDDDNDGLPDLREATLGTSRTDLDSDDDGLRDDAEGEQDQDQPDPFRHRWGSPLGRRRARKAAKAVPAEQGSRQGHGPGEVPRDRDRTSKTSPRRRRHRS